MQTKAILYQNLRNFALLSAIFILGPYCAAKAHTSTSICCLHPGKKARPKKNHKKEIRGRKSRTFCFRKTSFVHSRSGTYYALLLGCLCLKFLPVVRYCVCWVLAEIWCPDSSHKIDNKFFIDVLLYVKLFDFFRGRILILLTWNLSRFVPNSVEILGWNFRKKTISGEFFGNFVQTKAILYQNLWNFALLSTIFILGPCCTGKVHTSTSICCLHPGKEARP